MSLKRLLSLSGLALLSACSSDDSAPTQTGGPPEPPLPEPAAEFVPKPTGTCPGFADGAGCTSDDTSLICTFSPATLVPRPVRIWMSEAAREQDGPTVVFWHGLGGQAANAAAPLAGLGPDVTADIVAKGGILAAPERSEKRQMPTLSQLPWLIAMGTGDEDDLLVMDEVVACASQEVGIDLRRVHTTGMSAGGLQTGQVGSRRSGYLASTVVFSGGQPGRTVEQNPDNKFAAMLFHGGPQDIVLLNFSVEQTNYHKKLLERGQFALLCDHGRGHLVPPEGALGGWEFMQAHPYGVTPEPYANGLPETIPAYCVP